MSSRIREELATITGLSSHRLIPGNEFADVMDHRLKVLGVIVKSLLGSRAEVAV
ncbi:MAG TPA: hypothetical protein VK425_08885 [Acidimicrobiales bacterium]|nr:hypothetical protein [Acidimicrobiales bacterium]